MRRLTLIALAGCALLMTSCAGLTPRSTAAAPQVGMPAEARRPCSFPTLGGGSFPTQSDLESAYTARGAALVACDGARGLAVQTHDDEHALEAKADAARAARARPWWKLWP